MTKRIFAWLATSVLFGSILTGIMYLVILVFLPSLPYSLPGLWIATMVAMSLPPHLKEYQSLNTLLIGRLRTSFVTFIFVALVALLLDAWTYFSAHLFVIWLGVLIGGTSMYFLDLQWQSLYKKLSE